MNPKHLPKQIRKDLETALGVLTSDKPCNALWLEAAAALLEDVAAQVRAAVLSDKSDKSDRSDKSDASTATTACQAAGF